MTYRRATFTMTFSRGKLFKIFPWVLSPKVRNPAKAMAKHASIEANVEKWVTRANLSIVGFFREPYINRELWSNYDQ